MVEGKREQQQGAGMQCSAAQCSAVQWLLCEQEAAVADANAIVAGAVIGVVIGVIATAVVAGPCVWFSGNRLGEAGGQAIGAGLAQNCTLTSLDLTSERVGW